MRERKLSAARTPINLQRGKACALPLSFYKHLFPFNIFT